MWSRDCACLKCIIIGRDPPGHAANRPAATAPSLADYGYTGDQGGVVEGLFEFCWKGETLHARNNAVGDSYLLGAPAGGIMTRGCPRPLNAPPGSRAN